MTLLRIQSDVAAIRNDIRRLEDRVRIGLRRLDDKADFGLSPLGRKFDAKRDAGKDDLSSIALRMEQGFARLGEEIDRKLSWVIGLMLMLAAGGVIGFLWLGIRIDHL